MHDVIMKKLFLTLLLLMTLITGVKANPFGFGVTAGMNIAKSDKGAYHNYMGWTPDEKNGWFVGFQLKASLPIIGLGLDLSALYSEESVSIPVPLYAFDNMGGDYSHQIKTESEKLNYLAVPLHLRYDLSIPGVNLLVVPFIFTGPQAGIRLSKLDNTYKDKITTNDLVWHYDLGAGLILFKHIQMAYSYSFPMTKTYEGKFSEQKDQFYEDYEHGVHRLSLTFYF